MTKLGGDADPSMWDAGWVEKLAGLGQEHLAPHTKYQYVCNRIFLYVLLTSEKIAMLSVKLATETYCQCRDQTGPFKQTGGPDFVT